MMFACTWRISASCASFGIVRSCAAAGTASKAMSRRRWRIRLADFPMPGFASPTELSLCPPRAYSAARGPPGGEMRKKLLAVAVAGALAAPCIALAQGSVEVTGRITTALGRVKYSQSTSGVPGVSKWDVIQGGSLWGIRGRESLGGGLTAWFEISQNALMEQ